jgi:AraC family transcriptional regulator
MHPRIETLPEKKLVGKWLEMSFANNKTAELWRSFMPRKKEISNTASNALFSMQLYGSDFDFSPAKPFVKWAAVEVLNFDAVPNQMETFVLESGLYAVFEYKGLNTDTAIFDYIFLTWLPNSAYTLDTRPHFELLGEKYSNNDPNSEEELWIPICLKV